MRTLKNSWKSGDKTRIKMNENQSLRTDISPLEEGMYENGKKYVPDTVNSEQAHCLSHKEQKNITLIYKIDRK